MSTLQRNSSNSTWKIIPLSFPSPSPTPSHSNLYESKVQKHSIIPFAKQIKTITTTKIVQCLLRILPISPWMRVPPFMPSPRRRVTGTMFGRKNGPMSFAVQFDPQSEPVMLVELATLTSSLMKEMASGTIRIALECKRGATMVQLMEEPVWTMYCNGRKWGYSVSRTCGELDWHLLRSVQTVSVGAGVLPAAKSSQQLMYMRAGFERVVGSGDSEVLYMVNPEGSSDSEFIIFLSRF